MFVSAALLSFLTPSTAAPVLQSTPCTQPCSPVAAPPHPQQFTRKFQGKNQGAAFRRVGATDFLWTAEDGGRVRLSTDHGVTFVDQETPREVRSELRSIYFLSNGQTGWGVSADGFVIGTQNGGGCWKTLASFGASQSLFDVWFADANEGWLAGDNLLMHSTDGGCSWSAESYALPTGITDVEFYALDFAGSGASLIGVASAEPGLVLQRSSAGTWSVALYVSQQHGVPSIPPGIAQPDCCGAGGCSAPLELWDVELTPSSTSSSATAFVVGGAGTSCGEIYRGAWNGTSWSWNDESHVCELGGTCASLAPCTTPAGCSETLGYDNFSTLYGVYVIDDDDVLACGYAAQMVKRNPATGAWTDVTNRCAFGTQPLLRILGDHGSLAWNVGMFGAVRFSDSAGATWNELSGHDNMRLDDVFFVDGQTGWLAAQRFTIHRTTDGGTTWRKQRDEGCSPTGKTFRGICMSSASVGVAVGDSPTATTPPTVLFTSTGGVTIAGNPSSGWLAASLPSGLNGLSLADVACRKPASAPQEFWAVGGGVVLRSNAAGQSWSTVTPPASNIQLNALAFLESDQSVGVVVGQTTGGTPIGVAFGFVVSASGVSWVDISPTTPTRPLNDVAAASTAIVAVGGDILSGVTSPGHGAVLVLDWATLKLVSLPQPESLSVDHTLLTTSLVHGSGGDEVFIGGDRGFLLYLSPSTGGFVVGDTECETQITGMQFLSSTTGFITGAGGSIFCRYGP